MQTRSSLLCLGPLSVTHSHPVPPRGCDPKGFPRPDPGLRAGDQRGRGECLGFKLGLEGKETGRDREREDREQERHTHTHTHGRVRTRVHTHTHTHTHTHIEPDAAERGEEPETAGETQWGSRSRSVGGQEPGAARGTGSLGVGTGQSLLQASLARLPPRLGVAVAVLRVSGNWLRGPLLLPLQPSLGTLYLEAASQSRGGEA